MPITYQRIDPTGALYGLALVAATVQTLVLAQKTTKQIAPVPSDNPVPIPLGSVGPQVTVGWNIRSEAEFLELRKWNPNFYIKVAASTFDYEIPAGSVWLIDDVKTSRKKGSNRKWAAVLTMTREWNWEADLVSPTPPEITTSTARTDGVIGVALFNVDTPTEALDIPVESIEFSFKSSKQDVAIPGEHHIGIPLGYEGPTITLAAILKGSDMVAATSWNGNTTLAVEKTSYLEFDIDDPPTNYSRWMIDNIGWKRMPTNASRPTLAEQEWHFNLTLVRYWGQELI